MLVCPACRQANPEGATVCEHCGSQLTASFALPGGRSAPPEIDIPARNQAQQLGIQSGPIRHIRLGGRPAEEWAVSALAQQTFRGVEVATVVDGAGWTVQLDDDVSTSAQDATSFRVLLASWHFR